MAQQQEQTRAQQEFNIDCRDQFSEHQRVNEGLMNRMTTAETRVGMVESDISGLKNNFSEMQTEQKKQHQMVKTFKNQVRKSLRANLGVRLSFGSNDGDQEEEGTLTLFIVMTYIHKNFDSSNLLLCASTSNPFSVRSSLARNICSCSFFTAKCITKQFKCK